LSSNRQSKQSFRLSHTYINICTCCSLHFHVKNVVFLYFFKQILLCFFPFQSLLGKTTPPSFFVCRPITHALSKLLNYSSIWHTNYSLHTLHKYCLLHLILDSPWSPTSVFSWNLGLGAGNMDMLVGFCCGSYFRFCWWKKKWKVAHGEDFRWHSLISLMFYLLLDFKLLLSYNAAVLVSLYGLKFCIYKLQHNLKWKALLLANVSLLLLWLRFENQRMWDLGKGERGNGMERRWLRRVEFC